MTAIRRPNTVTGDERPIEVDSREAVLGISVGIGVLWFAREIVFPPSSKANLGIPDARHNGLVCIAAIYPLQCNKVIRRYKPKKPPRRGRPFGFRYWTRPIRRPASAAGRAHRNRGFP